MAYNTDLELLIDVLTGRWKDMRKKRMFGGICYLLKGNMCFGIYKDFLIMRMDKALAEEKLRKKNVQAFDITGRPMSGWVMVGPEGWKKRPDLAGWLAIGRRFALTLPEKAPKTRKRRILRSPI